MKNLIICIVLLTVSEDLFAQKTQIFSISPMAKNTQKVNGLVIGIGHFDDADDKQPKEINGLNIDVLIFSVIPLMYMDPNDVRLEQTALISRGVNVGLGGLYSNTEHTGLSASLYNMANKVTGINVSVVNSIGKMHGLHIAAIGNYSLFSHGLTIAPVNKSERTGGVQIGLYNKSSSMRGLQIGLFNRSSSLKGIQLGLWNVNGKRRLPLINF